MSKIQHIALVKFKAETTPEQIDEIFSRLLDVTEIIPGIENFVSGPNNSPEALAQGYSHGMVMTFESSAARDAYLPHPEHEKFKTFVAPHIDSIAVVDFEL